MLKVRGRWIAVTAAAGVLLLAWSWQDAPPPARADDYTRPPAEAVAITRAPAQPGTSAVRSAARLAANDQREASRRAESALASCSRDHARALQERALALAASPDGRRHLASILLSPAERNGMDHQRERAIAAAIERAPDDALIAWVAAQHCHAPQCDQQAAIARVLRLEPDNVMAWTMAIAAEVSRGDLMQADRLLQQAAGAKRVDTHGGETARLVVDAIGPLPPSPVCEQASAAIASAFALDRPGTLDDLSLVVGVGIANAQLPTLRGILELCPSGRGIARHRQAACRQVFLRLAQSEELLIHGIGVRGLAAHAVPTSERARWRERLRELEWMYQQGGALMHPSHLPLAWEQGEVSVIVALLEAAGRWPMPEGWLPDDPGTRALIEGGTPPSR